jgi:gamma-glutamyltranspeptidase/glutathione hydrolase
MSQRNAATTDVEAWLHFTESELAGELAGFGHQWTIRREIGAASGIEFNDDGTVTAVSEPVRRGGGSASVQEP